MSVIQVGIVVIAGLGVGGVFVVAIVDAWLGARDHLTIGDRLLRWTRKKSHPRRPPRPTGPVLRSSAVRAFPTKRSCASSA